MRDPAPEKGLANEGGLRRGSVLTMIGSLGRLLPVD
jgi:hypothetical protein